MATLDLGRGARGSQQDIRLDNGRKTFKRGRIGRRLGRGEHVGPGRASLDGRPALEILPGRIGKVRRKPKLRKPRQALAQPVDDDFRTGEALLAVQVIGHHGIMPAKRVRQRGVPVILPTVAGFGRHSGLNEYYRREDSMKIRNTRSTALVLSGSILGFAAGTSQADVPTAI